MSLRTRTTEQAQAVAKKADHGELVPLHVLIALLQRSGSTQESLAVAKRKLDDTRLPRPSGGAIAVGPEAEALLARCTTEAGCTEVEGELVVSILGLTASAATEDQQAASSPPPEPEQPSVEECLAELDALIGLEGVKVQVKRLVAVHKANAVRVAEGRPRVPVGLHLVFTGSPGTGKTSVARVVAKIYRATGLLPSGQLVEVDRGELVAGYVGQTALKVREIVEKANGGVLFIDEAYSLASDSGAGYGDEAIAALVKAMEDRRQTLAVIVAGYQEPMKDFVATNPGLKSRFQTFIEFPDYSADELHRIFTSMSSQHDVVLKPDVSDAVLAHLAAASTTKEAGNARYVRNMFETMFANMSIRADSDGTVDLAEVVEFVAADVPAVPASRGSGLGFISQA